MMENRLITTGNVVAICLSPIPKSIKMQSVQTSKAIAGCGLEGDRYALGLGSFNKKRGGVGYRQVSFIDARFFKGTPFEYIDSYRNVVTDGVELLWLIGREYVIGDAKFRGLKYLDPCEAPSKRSGKPGFKETFFDCGAIIAEVLESGSFSVNDPVYHESKGY
jgi:hypothetical protein